jgi:low temperature requirement protein LtrA
LSTSTPSASRSRAAYRAMRARPIDEPNRTATPLELLFDLTFVVAVAQLAGRLAHATLTGHAMSAIGPFLMVFFAIWWAWMNFTWFASAFDCDDVPYRLATFVQIGGVLILAAGTGLAFDRGVYTAVTLGYLVMRIGLLRLWIRAAVEHPATRPTAIRYATGIAVLTVLWLGRLGLGGRAAVATFLVLAVLEMLVPIWAERRGATNWHPHHIAERYSLFTIILLGESMFAATTAVVAVVEDAAGPDLTLVSASSLVIVAALWWLYFAVPAGAGLETHRHLSYVWGYGHYLPFAALAALGAGLEVVVEASAGHAEHSATWVAVLAVAAPVTVVVVAIELLRIPADDDSPRLRPATVIALLALAGVVAISGRVGLTVAVCLVAVTVAAAVAADLVRPRVPRR